MRRLDQVASISISPWYRCHGGRRTRTITLQIGSNVFYDHIDKLPSEPKEVSESRCKRTIERMLQGAMNLISTLEV